MESFYTQTQPSNAQSPPPPPPKSNPPPHEHQHQQFRPPPPRPPLPPNSSNPDTTILTQIAHLLPVQDGWLPAMLKSLSTADLHHVLSTPALHSALTHAPETAHPSLTETNQLLTTLLQTNTALATSLFKLEEALHKHRTATQSRLLSQRALERQFTAKQAEQDAALRDFSSRGLFATLSSAVVEGEMQAKAVEESFLEGSGEASEREVNEWVRGLRELRKGNYLRREGRERWDEGRIGGLRG